MTPSGLLGSAATAFFLLLTVLPARAAVKALALERRAELPSVVFWSITKVVWLLGPVLVISVLVAFSSDGLRDNGGIMGPGMAIGVLVLGAFLALLMIWVSAISLGFFASAVARNMPGRTGAAVVLGMLALAPMFCLGTYLSNVAAKKSQQWRP